jgi:RecB family exonuclease
MKTSRIETLERRAYAFAVKHLSGEISDIPVKLEPEAAAETVIALQGRLAVEHVEGAAPDTVAALQGEPTAVHDEEVASESADGSTSSRWRIRLNARQKAESAS